MRKPKIILWDIEATNLDADFGNVICVGYKYLGEKAITVISLLDNPEAFKRDFTDDRTVLKKVYDVLADADAWVTWYGSKFDVPFMNSRYLFHKMPPLPKVPHVDGWYIARYRMKIHSNRLSSAADFLGVSQKTPLKGEIWRKAGAGNRRAIEYVVRHCRQDVKVLEQVYERIRPLARQHPNMGLLIGDGRKQVCPTCGRVGVLAKRGFRITSVGRAQRYQCRRCGAWCSDTPIKQIDLRQV